MSNQITTTDQQSKLKELIAKGKEQGFLTYGEVNDHPVSYTHLTLPTKA